MNANTVVQLHAKWAIITQHVLLTGYCETLGSKRSGQFADHLRNY
jgi:hypothetical protein